MKILNKLTIKNLLLNKRRSIVTIIGVVLSTSLIVGLFTLVTSLQAGLLASEIEDSGYIHYTFSDVPATDLTYFINNRNIKNTYLEKYIGYAKVNSENLSKPYLYIMALNNESMSNLGLKLISGRYPSNDSEIVISNHLKTNGGVSYNIGDTLTLDIGNRYSEDTILYNDTKYLDEEEILNIKESKTYTIVGIIERPSYLIENYYAPGYTVITFDELNNLTNDDYLKVYTTLKKASLYRRYQVVANLLGVDSDIFEKYYTGGYYWDGLDEDSPSNQEYLTVIEKINKAKYKYEENGTLIQYETLEVFEDTMMLSIYKIAIIIVIIIMTTSVTCISNSFNISITEKLRQYGMLKSVGATKKQIKKNVYYEAFILSIIGIPIGIFAGLLAIYILCMVTKNLFINAGFDITMKFDVSIISIILATLVSSLTIFLSSRKSAKIASRTTPIASIKSSKEIKSKNLKVPRIIKIFKTGGILAYKSQKRYKSKYRITVISIIVCVSVFIGLSYFVNLFKEQIYKEYDIEYNIEVYPLDNSYTDYQDIISLNNIEKYSIQKYNTFLSNELKYTPKIKNTFSDSVFSNDVLIYSISKDEFTRYIDKLNLKYEDVWDKGILINYNTYELQDNYRAQIIYYEYLDNQKGDVINGCFATKDIGTFEDCGSAFDITIGFITDELPMGDFFANPTAPTMIVNEEYFNQYFPPKTGTLYIESSDATSLEKDINDLGKSYNVNNIDTQYKKNKNLLTLVCVFLYGFITVISLIGLTNIFNTLTTGMLLRKKEFASLRSVGMTSLEFRQMIFLESFFYCMKSLIIGIPLGIILSYVIYITYGEDILYFKVPILAIIISIIVVLILVNILMFYSLSKIKKDNIIEDIREENI